MAAGRRKTAGHRILFGTSAQSLQVLEDDYPLTSYRIEPLAMESDYFGGLMNDFLQDRTYRAMCGPSALWAESNPVCRAIWMEIAGWICRI